MSFQYSVDRKITDVLAEKSFTISAEIVPPRNGQEQYKIITQLERLLESNLDFLSVTKGAGGSLRGGSLPIAQAIKDHFNKPCIAHFTCRDLLPQEIESHLVDHHYFGIRNILALRGDPPMGVTEWKAREGGYSYAYELIQQIRALNSGEYLKRGSYEVRSEEKTDFCIGAAVYPEHPDQKERIDFVAKKFEAGAEYGITQMLFDVDAYKSLLEGLAQRGVNEPILPGLRILKSKKQASVMEQRFGCKVPTWYSDLLPDQVEKPLNFAQLLEPFYQLVEQLRSAGAPGVHLFVLSDTEINAVAMSYLLTKEV